MQVPPELQQLFNKHKPAATFFESLAFTHRREYIEWIVSAKKQETKARRLETTVARLLAGKKKYSEK